MNHSDQSLKQALAKMLPRERKNKHGEIDVLDTELLHICWLVEETLDATRTAFDYSAELRFVIEPKYGFVGDYRYINATWQQRTIALAKVKGVEI